MANQIAYESITVSSTAIGPTVATATRRCRAAVFAVEAGRVRYRSDATDPTASVGFPMEIGGVYVFTGEATVLNAKFIRRDAIDATVECVYFSDEKDAWAFAASAGTVGNVPSHLPDTGPPQKIGGHAYSGNPGAVDNADRVDAHFDVHGKLGVFIGAVGGNSFAGLDLSWEDGDSITTDRLAVDAAIRVLGPDGSLDCLRSVGDTAGSGLGALMTSPTGHAHNSVTADEQILGAKGQLHTITIHEITASGTITVFDSLTETGTVIALLEVTTGENEFVTLHYDVHCATGLYIGYDGTAAAALTVSYSV